MVNNIIFYKEDNVDNIIDLNNKTYTRENNEYIFKVDFQKKEFLYTLKDINKTILHNLTKCSIKIESDIELIYSLDDEEKRILIHLY